MRLTLQIDVDRSGSDIHSWKDLIEHIRFEADRLQDHIEISDGMDAPVRPMITMPVMSYDGYWRLGLIKVTD